MSHKLGLRVAIIWRGAVLEEHMFDSGQHVYLSGDPTQKHTIVIPDFQEMVEGFAPVKNGYTVHFPEHATGTITRDGAECSLEEIQKEAKKSGSVKTTSGSHTLFGVDLKEGDWGLITINDVSLYFQLRDASIAVPITAFDLPIQAPLAASILISGILHATFLMIVMLYPEADPLLRETRALDRFASFMVEDVESPPELEEVEENVPIEEDTTGKKAGGEEGKFGDEESEFEESEIPKVDGQMVDKVDVKNIGINKALSADVLGSGALKNVFGNSNGLEAKMDVALSGTAGGDLVVGRGSGGTSFRGGGSGGGGEGLGRVAGLGSVDTGGGKGTGKPVGKIGKKKKQKVSSFSRGTPSLGNFCDKNDIRRVVNSKTRAIKYCFEKQLQTDPSLSGKVSATWQVGLDGGVLNASIASSTLNNKEVEGCIVRAIKQMRFQKPDGGICVINYPFVFTGLE